MPVEFTGFAAMVAQFGPPLKVSDGDPMPFQYADIIMASYAPGAQPFQLYVRELAVHPDCTQKVTYLPAMVMFGEPIADIADGGVASIPTPLADALPCATT